VLLLALIGLPVLTRACASTCSYRSFFPVETCHPRTRHILSQLLVNEEAQFFVFGSDGYNYAPMISLHTHSDHWLRARRLMTVMRLAPILLLGLLLAACASAAPTPDPDGPVLTGFDALPKNLATAVLTATPNAPQLTGTATAENRTPTAGSPRPVTWTPSPTSRVGVFMGASTFSAGSLLPTGTRPIPQVTLPPLPGTRAVPPPPGVAAQPGTLLPGVPPAALNCAAPARAPFAAAAQSSSVAGRLGCPKGEPFAVQMAAQSFQNGFMFWRSSKEIYVIATGALKAGAATDTYWRVPDNWNDAIPASDSNLTPPPGLFQPIRGFGYVWRTNQTFRDRLGWALSEEQAFEARWQDFERGVMLTTHSGQVIALLPTDTTGATGIHFGLLPAS
jgi:hypothetical protein